MYQLPTPLHAWDMSYTENERHIEGAGNFHAWDMLENIGMQT